MLGQTGGLPIGRIPGDMLCGCDEPKKRLLHLQIIILIMYLYKRRQWLCPL
ncbi:MAG: hypothetical protein RL536_448 [Candidatus Parcubacteria bacterium]|jgi:hypothetical protein